MVEGQGSSWDLFDTVLRQGILPHRITFTVSLKSHSNSCGPSEAKQKCFFVGIISEDSQCPEVELQLGFAKCLLDLPKRQCACPRLQDTPALFRLCFGDARRLQENRALRPAQRAIALDNHIPLSKLLAHL